MAQFPVTFNLQPRLFAFLAAGFILATIVGTVSHELGHYLPAKYYGFNAKFSYAMVSYGENPEQDKMAKFYEDHKAQIMSPEASPEKAKFNDWMKAEQNKYFNTTLGGPLQTMLTGSAAFIILYLRRRKLIIDQSVTFSGWVLVLLSFFWSRQLANLILWVGDYLITGNISNRGDEIKMSRYILSLQHESAIVSLGLVGFLTGIAAAAILTYIVFGIIPKHQRFTFLSAGVFGSMAGAVIWFGWLGPAILPA